MKKITFLAALFLTFFNQANAQFNEGFDAGIPATWTVINGGDAANTWVQIVDPVFVLSGTASAAISYGATAHDDYLITPAITVVAGVNDRIIFKARSFDPLYPEQFDLKVSVSTPTAAAFTITLATIAPDSNLSVPTDYSFDLSAYVGQTIYIGMHSTTTDMWRICVDDFVNDTPPACLAPTTLSVSNVTATSVDLSWVDASGGAQFDYEYVVQAAGAGMPASGTFYDIDTLPVTVNSLSPNTSYEFWVRSDCGADGYSTWTGPFTFKTTCSAFAVPFSEGFNSTSTTQSCWTVLDGNSDGSFWDMDYTSNPFEGNQSAVIYTDFNNGDNDDWLISPAITLTGNQRLKFHYRVQAADEPNDFELLLSTTGIAPASFTNVLLPTTVYSNTNYIEQIIDLSAYTGDVNIAWHVPAGVVDGWRLYIDNVIVESIPTCIPPTNLIVSNITTTGVDLAWSHATATNFDYVVQPSGTGVPSSGTAVGALTVSVGSLNPASTYEVYIRTNCGVGDLSTWYGPINFSTACAPTNVPYTIDFEAVTIPGLPVCTSVVNEGAGNLWVTVNSPGYGFNTKALRYSWDSSNNANTWFYTNGVNLTAGTTYRITYDYGGTSTSYPEKLKVAYGTNPTAAAMTNVIEDHPNVVNGTPITYTEDFTPSTTGVYYFGFNAYSDADNFYLIVDNIVIDVSLSSSTFDSNAFLAYPNPVKDILNLEYNSEMSSVRVINLLGQEVISRNINANSTQVDMSQLSAGAYIVNVTVGDAVKTIKVVKQ